MREELKMMPEFKTYTYKDFWEMRGRQSIWVTRNISYRMGAVIALWAARLGVTPNVISVMSGMITVLSALVVFYMGIENPWSGVVLVLGLQLGYAFDCADGPLARATGKGSSFGMLLDKMVDLSSGMVFPCILAFGAGHYYWPYLSHHPDYTLRIILLVLIIRVFLNVLLWLKELVMYDADRLMEDPRGHTLWWKVKKSVSLYIDEPVYRLGIGLAWAMGWFWEFAMLYSAGILLINLVYLASTKREMDEMDLRKLKVEN